MYYVFYIEKSGCLRIEEEEFLHTSILKRNPIVILSKEEYESALLRIKKLRNKRKTILSIFG